MTSVAGSSGSRRFVRIRTNALRPIPLGLALAIAVLALIGVRAAWIGLTPSDPDGVWRQAEVDVRAGRFEKARAGLRRLEALRPTQPLDWLLRAQVANAQGRDAEALEALYRVPKDHPLAAQGLLMAGRIERQHHRLRRAEAAFRQALTLDPGSVQVHNELIYILGIQLRRREVDAEFKALSRLTQLTHHDLFTWGLTHFTVWGPDIETDLEAFIQADPEDRYSRLALANLLFDQPAMEGRVERILEPLPLADPDAAALRIEMKLTHGHTDMAVTMLQDSPSRHPHLARLRGRVALMQGDHASAIGHFQDALSEEPYDRVALSELGKALLLHGDKSAAEGYLTRARRLDDVYNLINRVSKPNRENQAPDLTQLGRACAAAGLNEEARGWYMLAISRQPLDSEAQQALYGLSHQASVSRRARSGLGTQPGPEVFRANGGRFSSARIELPWRRSTHCVR